MAAIWGRQPDLAPGDDLLAMYEILLQAYEQT